MAGARRTSRSSRSLHPVPSHPYSRRDREVRARVLEEIAIDLAKPRDQLTTREDPRFLAARHRVISLIRSTRAAVGANPGHTP